MARNIRLTEQLKLALNYADESSKRVRSIVFLLQLAVVLVLAGVWQQAESNWIQLRVDRASKAVRMLTCDPQNIDYGASPQDSQDAVNQIFMSKKNKTVAQMTPEEAANVLSCRAAAKADEEERKKSPEQYTSAYFKNEDQNTRDYLEMFDFSSEQAKKNLETLRQIRASRAQGISVPVLGIVFDINDLSVLAALTFSILLSWLHFSLRRQKKNVQRVFSIAEDADEKPTREAETYEFKTLLMAYDLLAMSQVFTIPPGRDEESRNVSSWRLWTRVPTLIMWTAVIAELVVLIDDYVTMLSGDIFNPLVSHAETAIATYLFLYILYRTVTCFKLTRETYDEWVRAHNKSKQYPIIEANKPARWQEFFKKWRFRLIAGLVMVLAVVHSADDYHLLQGGIPFFRLILDGMQGLLVHLAHEALWLGRSLFLTAIVFCMSVFRDAKIKKTVAWLLVLLSAGDIISHILRATFLAKPTGFLEYMEGFYTSPLLMVGAAVYLLLLYRTSNATAGPTDPPAPPGNQASTTRVLETP